MTSLIYKYNNDIPKDLLQSSKEYLEDHEREVGLYVEVPFPIENPKDISVNGIFNSKEKLSFTKVSSNLFRCNEFHWELNSIESQKENPYSIEITINGRATVIGGSFKTDHFLYYTKND